MILQIAKYNVLHLIGGKAGLVKGEADLYKWGCNWHLSKYI